MYHLLTRATGNGFLVQISFEATKRIGNVFLISNFRRVLNVVCFLLGDPRRGITQKKAYNKVKVKVSFIGLTVVANNLNSKFYELGKASVCKRTRMKLLTCSLN